jgi:Ca2+-binding EF-hand superfamily protein
MEETEMLRGLQSLGLQLDSWETRRLMQLADADGSGALDVREFEQVEILKLQISSKSWHEK